MSSRPPPTPAPSAGDDRNYRVIGVSDRVFGFAVLTTLLVALAIALGFAVLGIVSFAELRAVREALDSERLRANLCERKLLQSDAKLEQLDGWLKTASQIHTVGGVGGPR